MLLIRLIYQILKFTSHPCAGFTFPAEPNVNIENKSHVDEVKEISNYASSKKVQIINDNKI